MESLKYKAEVVTNHKSLLGEGPVWDDETNTIYWVDILNGEIHGYSPANGKTKTLPVHEMIGAIGLCKDGNFIAGLETTIHFINKETGELQKITSHESPVLNNRSNDGKCDPFGRFWIGTLSKTEEPNNGGLYMLDNEGHIDKKVTGTTIANGMAWDMKKNIFYFIDTPTLGVDAYDFDGESGEIKNKRQVISFKSEKGYPDGMTIDSEGMLWIAHWDGWQVSRWNPETGEKLLSISLPVARVSCCTFGGPELSDLYITSARKELSKEELDKQPLAGSLFVVRNTAFKGMKTYRFDK